MGNDFRVADWQIRPDLNLISCGDKTVQIEPRVMDVLVFFSRHPGEVLPKDAIIRAVWPNTFVSEEVLTYSVSELRRAFGDEAKKPRIIQTIPRRGYCLIAPVSRGEEKSAPVPPATEAVRKKRGPWKIAVPALVTLAVAAAAFWFLRQTPALADSDYVLLTDFVNTTGDPVFDHTLKIALAVNLQQSPFLNIFSDEKARETLTLMNRQPDETMTKDIGREVCQRQGVKGMLAGSISSHGRNYVISLEAINAQTGDVIALEQGEADSKEKVLQMLGEAATRMRQKLGESLSSIRQLNLPLAQATTPSLEALKLFSLGRRQAERGLLVEAIPLYLHAIELDPEFAGANASLGTAYWNLGEQLSAEKYLAKAYELKGRATERENLVVSGLYHFAVTRDLPKAQQAYELWRSTYPKDAAPVINLASLFNDQGQYDKAVEVGREAVRLGPHQSVSYTVLANAYLGLGRTREAKAVLDQAVEQKRDSMTTHLVQFLVASYMEDAQGMMREADWAKGKPDEFRMISVRAAVAAHHGRMKESRGLSREAIELARQKNMKDGAASIAAGAALNEAALGNCDMAREFSAAALDFSPGRAAAPFSALALAVCGDVDRTQTLAEELDQRYPRDTLLTQVWSRLIRAANELHRGNHARAVELLRPVAAYEHAAAYWPNYLRGEAYRQSGAAGEAAAEFQKILRHRGEDPGSPLYVLAHLGMGRAMKLTSGTAQSVQAYKDFFSAWKDADPEIPILRQARAEYENLK